MSTRLSKNTKLETFERQDHVCASCGDSAEHPAELQYHHVVTQQEGKRQGIDPKFMQSADNTVGLCPPCHEGFAHDGGHYRTAAEGPESFPHSHGKGPEAAENHARWCQEIDQHTAQGRQQADSAQKQQSMQADLETSQPAPEPQNCGQQQER